MTDRLHADTEPRKAMLAQQLDVLCREIIERVGSVLPNFPTCDPDCACSRDNLLAYLVLRDHDLRDVQLELAELGL